jgi:hypothetical protein
MKASKKGREKETKGQRPKSRQANSPKEVCHMEIMGTTKYRNLHQSHKAYQLKKGEVSSTKFQA